MEVRKSKRNNNQKKKRKEKKLERQNSENVKLERAHLKKIQNKVGLLVYASNHCTTEVEMIGRK